MLGEVFTTVDRNSEDGDEISMVALLRYHNVLPFTPDKEDVLRKYVSPFMVAFWSVAETTDRNKVNAIRTSVDVSFKLSCKMGRGSDIADTDEVQLKVPIITNTKALKAGDEVFVLKTDENGEPSEESESEAEPTPKRSRTSVPKAAPKSRGRGGRARGKGARGRR